MVESNKVVLIDDNTGRKLPGRRVSEGVMQALECKERVPIQQETQTLASTTYQNFFRLFDIFLSREKVWKINKALRAVLSFTIEDFNFESFWSGIGGFVGIFLGYSMMQFPEALIYIFHF